VEDLDVRVLAQLGERRRDAHGLGPRPARPVRRDGVVDRLGFGAVERASAEPGVVRQPPEVVALARELLDRGVGEPAVAQRRGAAVGRRVERRVAQLPAREELVDQRQRLGLAAGELRDRVADLLADLRRVADGGHEPDRGPERVAPAPSEQRVDAVADVPDDEHAREDLAEDVLRRRARRVVLVGAEERARVAADGAFDRVAGVARVPERVVVLAVRLAVPVGVGGERVGVLLELLAVGDAVAVAVGAARIRAELGLLEVREPVAV
jgi:hypothetical protein